LLYMTKMMDEKKITPQHYGLAMCDWLVWARKLALFDVLNAIINNLKSPALKTCIVIHD
jgi:hypothetical protein